MLNQGGAEKREQYLLCVMWCDVCDKCLLVAEEGMTEHIRHGQNHLGVWYYFDSFPVIRFTSYIIKMYFFAARVGMKAWA